LEFRDVIAHFFSNSFRSASDPASAKMSTAISLTILTASTLASRMLFITRRGCTPSSRNGLICLRNSAARSTTVVVPSPTSASCDREMSTRALAAGWTMSSIFMMVAPSLEMVTPPEDDVLYMSLSMPLGPSVVRTTSATAMHALMFEMTCARP